MIMKKTRLRKGISLIETIVSLSIFSLALAILYTFFVQGFRFEAFATEQQLQIESARRSLRTMVKELREASAGDDGGYILQRADDFDIIFYSDIDSDLASERVRYFLDGTTFKKGVIEPVGDPPAYPEVNEQYSVLSEFVRNETQPIFTYYNGNYPGDLINNPLPTPTRLTATKLLHIYLKINVHPDRAPEDTEITSEVQIRNLKNNL